MLCGAGIFVERTTTGLFFFFSGTGSGAGIFVERATTGLFSSGSLRFAVVLFAVVLFVERVATVLVVIDAVLPVVDDFVKVSVFLDSFLNTAGISVGIANELFAPIGRRGIAGLRASFPASRS